MKKILFGTTALIAAGAFAATASADPISLSIGGKQEMFFGAGDVNDNAGETWASTGMATDTELYFSGETTLDNGITVRAVIQLEAEDSADRNADEQYITLSGGFGALQVGQKEGYAAQMQYATPGAGGVIDWDEIDDGWAPFGFVPGYYDDDDLSVSYVTPSFFGFSLAGTYAPDSSNNDDSAFQDWNDTGSDYKDLLSVGAAFDNEFSGVGIHADVTYQYQFGTTTREALIDLSAGQVTDLTTQLGIADPGQAVEVNATSNNADRSLLRGGLALSYMGFEVGGHYGHWYVDGANNDMEGWGVGAGYTNGPYGVAFNYRGGYQDAANDVHQDGFMFSGNYILAPGIDLGAAVFHANQEVDNAADREVTGVLFGIGLSF
ncbi:outer membrane protein OmpU [Rhodospira trueperi]|uniref:Outer membrane protein OmpU n=2 Tax=Rhodospira trueperi TaxID=69960 RepID=A0A1G7AUP2_9PROT|nr:outer membrane protein OmpU [Rhodospira trueperi]